jgi:hypothetical protein
MKAILAFFSQSLALLPIVPAGMKALYLPVPANKQNHRHPSA